MQEPKIKPLMNILCATDDNFVPYCGIMLTSLFENNQNHKLKVFILTESLNEENMRMFSSLSKKYGQDIKIIKVSPEKFKGCPIDPEHDHVSIATYYRLAVTELIPSDISKILYLDGDIIVTNDLMDFYKMDISPYAGAAIRDVAYNDQSIYSRLNINQKPENPYFNAGVLLMNLDYWRINQISRKCMQYIKNNTDKIVFHDQDTLNAVLLHDTISVSPKYNLQSGFIIKSIMEKYDSCTKQRILETAESPHIVHFTGSAKPWFKGSKHPYAKLWLKYKKKSLWAKYPLKKTEKPITEGLRNWAVRLMWKLHIKPIPQTYIIPMQK